MGSWGRVKGLHRITFFALVLAVGCSEASGPQGTFDAGMPVGDDAGAADAAMTNTPVCDAAFDADDACGGDPVGVWQFVGVCGTIDAVRDFQMMCPEVELVRESLSPMGTLRATAGGSYRVDATIDFDVDVELPVSCVESIGRCAGFAFVVELAIDGSATCSEVAAKCECRIMGREVQTRDGTFTVGTNTFTSSAAGKVEEHWFCQDGDAMTTREIGQDVIFVVER